MINKRYKLIVLIVMILGIVIFGCSNSNSAAVSSGDYVSITYSKEAEGSDDIKTQILSYDCNKKKIQEVFEFEYTSQYPLGYYDRKNELVYYTKRVKNKEEYGDQIFVTDLSNHKELQLTDNLFAVNYVIPSENKIFFVGRPKHSEVVKLGSIDKNTNQISYWGDGDTNVEALTVDEKNKKVYISAYSEKERQYNVTHQDGPVGQLNFKMPLFTVYEINYTFENTQKLISKNMHIRTIMNNKDSIFALCDEKYNDDAPSILCTYNLLTKEETETAWEKERLQVGDANFSSDEKSIYGISKVGDGRGLFKFNMNTRSYEKLFVPKDGFINNVQVIK